MGHINQFNQLAANYDTPKNRDMAKRSTDAIRSLLDKNHTKTAIDLGCGTGNVGLDLLEEFESMLFVDASTNMIEQVEKKISRYRYKKKRQYYVWILKKTFSFPIKWIRLYSL